MPMARTAIYLLAWFALLISATAFAARFAPVVNHVVLLVAALSPYLVILAGFAVLPVLLTQWRWAAAPALALVVATAAVHAPLFFSRTTALGTPIRVVTANVSLGNADPIALAALAHDSADVVVLQELTPELATNLASLESEFPYRVVAPHPSASGVGIWSRYPIAHSSQNPNYQLGVVSASLRVPNVPNDVVIVNAHIVGPWPQALDAWRRELARFPGTLGTTADDAPGAVIVAGDLNATVDMQPFRRLLRDGYQDAAAQSGAGFIRTFPTNKSLPPLLGIDHILTFKCTATDLRTVPIPGSDHLGLATIVHVPD